VGSVTAADPSIATVRAAIDTLDRQIVALIAERQAQVVQAGILKRGQVAETVQAPARVEDVIGRVRTLALDAGASPDVVEATYRAMIGAFITLELDVHRG
jgi:isochorismate pyruvate lyase